MESRGAQQRGKGLQLVKRRPVARFRHPESQFAYSALNRILWPTEVERGNSVVKTPPILCNRFIAQRGGAGHLILFFVLDTVRFHYERSSTCERVQTSVERINLAECFEISREW